MQAHAGERWWFHWYWGRLVLCFVTTAATREGGNDRWCWRSKDKGWSDSMAVRWIFGIYFAVTGNSLFEYLIRRRNGVIKGMYVVVLDHPQRDGFIDRDQWSSLNIFVVEFGRVIKWGSLTGPFQWGYPNAGGDWCVAILYVRIQEGTAMIYEQRKCI